jgi:3',5'-cyclic-AMP phosphodiesterase
MSLQPFQSLPVNQSGTVSWIHIGDTHITHAREQNEADLGKIIDEINRVYAHGGIDFVFMPGDIADDGSVVAYRSVRAHLDRLVLPWCAMVGDHDFQARTFANFQTYIASELYSAFTVGAYHFFRLNAFSEPRPESFIVDADQLDWLQEQLLRCGQQNGQAVLLLHCYPSDFKHGGARLTELLRRYPVLLVDMGHTHYNELSNDGTVLYSTTRSTGQVEEGPVGYSVVTLDEGVVSWHFVRLGSPALVAITHPADYRLSTTRTNPRPNSPEIYIRAKIWSRQSIRVARAHLKGKQVRMSRTAEVLWTGVIDSSDLEDGIHRLLVTVQDSSGAQLSSETYLSIGQVPSTAHSAIDQENAIGAWTERDILGTQLGPNKNGRKW